MNDENRNSDSQNAEKGEFMPSNFARIDYEKCHPEKCDSGVCAAVLACSLKLIKQEASYETPMIDASACLLCGDCVRACPLRAISMVGM